MKKLGKYLLMTMLITITLLLTGCFGPSKEQQTAEALKAKYNEEFVVHNLDVRSSSKYFAYVSPVNNPDVVFETLMSNTGYVSDNYPKRYVSKLVEDILKEDLEEFFPGAYIHTDVQGIGIGELVDTMAPQIVHMSLEDILAMKTYDGSMCVDIYYDKEVGTNKRYEDEYKYFTDTVDDYIANNKMIPLTMSLYKVDAATIQRLENYFKHDLRKEASFDKDILGVQYRELHNMWDGKTDVGNPPNMSACLDKNYDVDVDLQEYVRRRELLENAK